MRRLRLQRLALTLLIALSAASAQGQRNWWEKAVIYQIYPRSFADSNGDGVGDLNGITQHLDYLQGLGVDAIWITPFFPSPQVDFGYDISDYTGIDPQYGTMADFDRLLAEAKRRNIRVILDFVVNHTSDKHAWFVESRSSRTNPKADWYVWRDAKPNHQPPNNWQSIFGHSAWEWDPKREQYYYHGFYKEQPDLNWRNSEVRKAMYDAARFWLRKGVAGFRLDAVTTLFEDPKLRDEPILKPGKNAYGDPILTREYTDNLPEVHDVLRELRAVTNEFPGAVLIAEAYLPNVAELVKMYGPHNDEVQLPMDTQFGFINQLSVPAFRARLKEAETQLRGNMPLLVLENHDNPRSLNRYGANGQPNPSIGKLLAALLLAPRDAALLYYGEELGMVNHDPARKEDVKDPIGRIGWPKEKGRDGERTPMQWTTGPNAGFSAAKSTWLPVPPDYKTTNVEVEERDPNSLLNFYKALIRLRKQNAALRDGDFTLVNENDNNVLSWLRNTKGQNVVVALNFTSGTQTVSLGNGRATAVLSSFLKAGVSSEMKSLMLPAYGVYIGQVQ